MIHVIPHEDLILHRADGECCDAFTDRDGLIIHHAADKREQFERNGGNSSGWIVCASKDDSSKLVPMDGAVAARQGCVVGDNPWSENHDRHWLWTADWLSVREEEQGGCDE